MKKSKIKNQKSKIPFDFAQGRHIKNKIFLIFSLILLFAIPLSAFAHETEVVHEEPVPTVSPVLLVGIVAVLAIGGFILWKFLLHTPKSSSPTKSASPDKIPPAQEGTISQHNQSDSSQKNG